MALSPRILFGVTVDQSIDLMGPLPATLAENNWDVYVVAGNASMSQDLATFQAVKFHLVKMSRQPSLLRDLFSLIGWFRAIHSIRPDLVLIATPKASLLGLFASWAFRVPIRVYWLWGLRLETAQGLSGTFLYLLEKLTAKCATHILAVSPSLATLYAEKGLAAERKIRVLGKGSSRGVDLRRFRPAMAKEKSDLKKLATLLGLDSEIPTIGVVGRLHHDKGLKSLLEALSHPAMSGVDCQVLVVGPDESGGRFNELAQEANVPIIFAGPTKAIEQYYRLMNVLCLPSLREGMPNVVLEALASGTPVITTDATGAIDSIEDKVVGLLVKRESAADLASALQLVLTDRATREAFSTNARNWVSTRFRESDVVDLHVDLVSSLGLARNLDIRINGPQRSGTSNTRRTRE